MRANRLALCALAALTLAGVAGRVYSSGTEAAPADDIRAIADEFAAQINEEKFDDMKLGMWRVAVDPALVETLNDQLAVNYKRLSEALGARTKVELLKTETAGPSIVRFQYAEFHTRGVVVWQFEFFKPKDAWKLHSYRFGPLQGTESESLYAQAGGRN